MIWIKYGTNASNEFSTTRRILRDQHFAVARNRIMRALAVLVIREYPAILSMHGVAMFPGVSGRTPYRHFPTKRAASLQTVFAQLDFGNDACGFGADHAVEALLAQAMS